MSKKFDLKPVEVWWLDSTSLAGYWKDFSKGIKEAKKTDLRIRSVGMLVEKTKDRVIISQSIGIEGEHIFGQMGGFLIIPRSIIVEIKEL